MVAGDAGLHILQVSLGVHISSLLTRVLNGVTSFKLRPLYLRENEYLILIA
jgi:hypothetical protein